MTKIIDFALAKAKTTLLIAFMIVIAGSYARQEIPIAASPNVQLPFITVSVFLDGASPSDTSRLIARPLENRLKTVTGVKNIRSTSYLSYARIFLEFEVGFDIDQALVDVKQGVEEIKYQLPLEAEDPQIEEYSEASFPVMNISIVGGKSVRQKVFYARELKDRIEPIEQILEVNMTGAPEEVLEGVIDKSKMESYGVTLSDIYNSVASNNLIIPGGKQDTGRGSFNIEVPSIIESAKDIYAIPVKVTKDAIVTLGEIASVKRTFKDFTSYARVNGQDAVTLEISLRESANAIDASTAIRVVLEDFELTLPKNLKIVGDNFLPITTEAKRKAKAFAAIIPTSPPLMFPVPPSIPATTVKIIKPNISSTTAAPIIVFASFVFKAPKSAKTLAVIPTDVAVIAAPTNRAFSKT